MATNVPGRRTSTTDPASIPDADAQGEQDEVDPELALPDTRRYDGADHGVEAGPEDATCGAHQGRASSAISGARENASRTLAKMPARTIRRAPSRSMSRRRTDNGRTDDGRHGEQAVGCLDPEPAHLMQVDEAERQHQPRAQRLDGDSGQKEHRAAARSRRTPARGDHARGGVTGR